MASAFVNNFIKCIHNVIPLVITNTPPLNISLYIQMYCQDTQEPGQKSCTNSFHRNGHDNTLSGLYATTLHRWSGIMDGRYAIENLDKLILTDKFIEVRERIEGTDVLIIDEISMVSASIFEQVKYVCRNLKNPKEYFDGLQVIYSLWLIHAIATCTKSKLQ